MDLENLSLAELKTLKKNVEKAIESFEQRQLARARAELEEKAKELGVKLEDVVSLAPKGKRAAAAPKYANPDNKGETWSGRGRMPLWIKAKVEAGHSVDEFLI